MCFLSIKINRYFTGKSAWTTYVFIWFVVSSLANPLCQYSELFFFFFELTRYFLSACFYEPWKDWIFPSRISSPLPNFLPPLPLFFLFLFFFLFNIFFKADKSKQICRESNNFAASAEEKKKKIALGN